MSTYKIVRFYRDSEHPDHHKVIDTGLSLDQAQDHCNDSDTSEHDSEGVLWFDGYYQE